MSPEEAKETVQKHVNFDFGKFLNEVPPGPRKDSRMLLVIGVALIATLTVFTIAAQIVTVIIRDIYQYRSRPSIQLVEPRRK